jgi:hypothetical protein
MKKISTNKYKLKRTQQALHITNNTVQTQTSNKL